MEGASAVRLVTAAVYIRPTHSPMNARSSAAAFLGLFVAPVLAQLPPELGWQKCLGGTADDKAFAIHASADGGYVAAGNSLSYNGDVTGNHGGGDIWLVKVDDAGALSWQNTLGGSGQDECWDVMQNSDGDILIAGRTLSSNADVSNNHGLGDMWVVKLDPLGTIIWENALGGPLHEGARSIQQTNDGGYIVGGWSASTIGPGSDVTFNHGLNDVWVVKLDALGELEWERSLGGSQYDDAFDVKQTADGGYIVAGLTKSNDGDASGHHGDYDFWVVKLDATGTLVWQNTLGGTGAEIAESIIQASDGGYMVVGTTTSNDGDVSGNHGQEDYWVVQLDALGELVWQKTLGGSGRELYCTTVQETSPGVFVVSGASNSNDGDVISGSGTTDVWLVQISGSGSIVWETSFGGSSGDVCNDAQMTDDGGLILAGQTYSNDGDVSGNHGAYDYWVLKLDGLSTSVEEFDQSAFRVWPNPARETVQLSIPPDLIGARLVITDAQGRVLQRARATRAQRTSFTIDTPGVYFVSLLTDSGHAVQRVVVE